MSEEPKVVALEYPGAGGRADHLIVELQHVRCASPLRVSYDFDRDGWLIETLAECDEPWSEDHAKSQEYGGAVFVPAWREPECGCARQEGGE